MSMSNASRKGLRKALPFHLGIWLGFSTVMILCTLFCSVLSVWIPKIKTPMLFLGACYMLYLAWSTFRSSGTLEERHGKADFLSGLLLQFLNPKIMIYCIVSMEVYILPVYQGQPLPLLGFALLLAVIGSACNIAWACFGSAFKWLFSHHAKAVNTIMALLLVYCALSLFLS